LGPRFRTLIWDPDLRPRFGTPIWIPNMDPHFGPRILTPNMDPHFGPSIWTPKMDPHFGPPFWTPILDPHYGGPQFEALIWDPDLGPRIQSCFNRSCHAPSLICAGIGQFGIQIAEGYSNCKINHPFSSLKTKHITKDTYIFASIKEHTA
jgi:hypothetical protein